MPDYLLAQRAAAGDPSDQRRFLDRVLVRVQRNAKYLAGNPADCEDLVQCALVQILRSAGGFRGESSLDRWVDRVTVQTAAKQLEKTDRRRRLSEEKCEIEAVPQNAEEDAVSAQLRQRLAMLFAALPAHQRIPVVLHYLHDYEVSEIAGLTETKLNTVRGRLREGLKNIRESILDDPVLGEWLEEVRRK